MSFEESPQKSKQFLVSFIYSLISLQAAWSTIMAEEVVANIRTVRAFGMEYHECEKFEKEVQKTAKLFKKLGFGIALFQVYIISCARDRFKVVLHLANCKEKMSKFYQCLFMIVWSVYLIFTLFFFFLFYFKSHFSTLSQLSQRLVASVAK